MAVSIVRDPFARATLERVTLRHYDGVGRVVCVWCGQPARFIYYWNEDSDKARDIDRKQDDAHPVCSIGCYRTLES
jgi:hypothetical protein